MAPTAKRKTGDWGEDLAHDYLVGQGYALLKRNWRMGRYELDLIMQKGTEVVFVEVKTRSSDQADPVAAVTLSKQNKMAAAAHIFMQGYNIPVEYRFDIIAVTGTPQKYTIEHIPDAFVPRLKKFNFSFHI